MASPSWAYPPNATKRFASEELDVRIRQAGERGFDVWRRYHAEAPQPGGCLTPVEIIVYRALPFDEACRRAEAMNSWLRNQSGPPPEWAEED